MNHFLDMMDNKYPFSAQVERKNVDIYCDTFRNGYRRTDSILLGSDIRIKFVQPTKIFISFKSHEKHFGGLYLLDKRLKLKALKFVEYDPLIFGTIIKISHSHILFSKYEQAYNIWTNEFNIENPNMIYLPNDGQQIPTKTEINRENRFPIIDKFNNNSHVIRKWLECIVPYHESIIHDLWLFLI